MDTTQANRNTDDVKHEPTARDYARGIAATVRAHLDAPGVRLRGARRTRELLSDLDIWIAGGSAPASAKRYCAAVRVLHKPAHHDGAVRAIREVLRSSAFRVSITNLLWWSAGNTPVTREDFSRALIHLCGIETVFELKHRTLKSRASNDNAGTRRSDRTTKEHAARNVRRSA